MAEFGRGNGEDESDRRVEFATQLRKLREQAGSPSFRKMAMRSGAISHTTLHEAAIGARFPSWATTREFVLALGGDEAEWRARWDQARTEPGSPAPDQPVPADGSPGSTPSGSGAAPSSGDPAPHPVSDSGGDSAQATDSRADSGPAPSPATAPTVLATVPEQRRKPVAILVGVLAVLLLSTIPIGFALAGNRHPATPTPPSAAEADPPSAAGQPNVIAAPRIPGDGSKFVADVTIPDGTTVRPGEHFTKIWEIANTGTVPWHGRFLRREGTPADNQGCGTPDQVPIPDTAPGSNVLISAPVVAPAESGSCWVGWKMVDSDGNYLFLGSRPVYFLVNVRP